MADRKRKEAPQAEQPKQPHLRVITGDELGLIRVADVPAGPDWEHIEIVARWGVPDKAMSVSGLALSRQGPTGQAALAIARATGVIDIMQALDGAIVANIPKATGEAAAASISGLAFLPRGSPEDTPESAGSLPHRLVSCTASGLVRVHAAQPEEGAASSSGQPGGPPCIPSQWREQASFQTCSNVTCMAVDASGQYVAVGGTGCHVQVWSLEQQQPVFKAKGGKPNRVGLVDLPNITALAFMPSASSASGGSAAAPAAACAAGSAAADASPPALQLLAGTAQHKLWLYRLAVGKRPQMEVAWGEAKITALAPEHDGNRAWVANGQGNMEMLDVGAAKVAGGLKGSGGSVKGMVRNSDLPVVASAGLDRYLRLHDSGSRKCLSKLYLKQQLTAVVFAPVPPVAETPQPQDTQEEQPAQEKRARGQEGPPRARAASRDDNNKAKSNFGSKKKKSRKN